jgi:hypothetical protein
VATAPIVGCPVMWLQLQVDVVRRLLVVVDG